MKGRKVKKQFFCALAIASILSVCAAPKTWAQDKPQKTPTVGPAEESAPAPKKMSTAQRVKELEERLKALEEKQGTAAVPLKSEDMVGPSNAPTVEDIGTNGSGVHDEVEYFNDANEYINSEGRHLTFGAPKGKVNFRIGGYMFADFNYYWQPMGSYLLNDYANQVSPFATVPVQKDYNGFSARKAHLAFGAQFDRTWGMDIGIESNKSAAVSLGFFHAYVYAKVAKWLVLTAGKFSNVLSLEAIQPSAALPFMEASMVANLVPNKDVGIMASGDVDHFFDYAVQVTDGVQDNESSSISPYKAEQNGKAITARIFFTPFQKSGDEWLEDMGIGIGASLDDETGALSISKSDISPSQNVPWPNGLATSLGGNEFAFDKGVAFADGTFYHWDPQAYWFGGPFGLQGEYVQSIQTVIAGPGLEPVQLTNTAWLAEAYFDIGGKPGFEGPQIDHPFNLDKGYWGDVEFVGRVHQVVADVKAFAVGFPYDSTTSTPNDTSLSTGAQVATAYGIGVNWWPTNNFKLMLDFERTDFSGGNAVDGNGKSTIPSEQVLFSRAALIL